MDIADLPITVEDVTMPLLVWEGMVDEMLSPSGMRARKANGRFTRLRLPEGTPRPV